MEVRFEGQRWTLAPEELGRFLMTEALAQPGDGAAIPLATDRVALANWLEQGFAELVNRDPVDAVVGWNEGMVAVGDAPHTAPELLGRGAVISTADLCGSS